MIDETVADSTDAANQGTTYSLTDGLDDGLVNLHNQLKGLGIRGAQSFCDDQCP